MRIVSVRARAWTLPLVAPFATSKRIAYDAQNVHVEILTESDTISGDGASAPVGYVTGEDVTSVLSALEAVSSQFVGLSTERLAPLLTLSETLLPDSPAARAGLEMAIYDAWAKFWRVPLWQHFGGAVSSLQTDVTIPIVAPEIAAVLARDLFDEGFRAVKIKVGDSAGGHEGDLARVRTIAEAAPGVRLRIDANQGFSPDGAIAFSRALVKTHASIDLLEQPVEKSDFDGLKYVRQNSDFPIFADESACSVADVMRLISMDAIDGVNVKLMKSGLFGAQKIVTLCQAANKKLMLGCMLETGLGIAAAAQIAGGLGAFDFLDLDSHRLLAPIPGLTGGFDVRGDTLEVGETEKFGWGICLPNEKTGNKTPRETD